MGLALSAVSLAQTETSPVLLSNSSAPTFTSQRVAPGPDRFSNTPALTTEGLVENLKTNKSFRTNLAKHFGVPEDRVVEFVQDALIPQTLAKDTRVMNYGVTKAGKIYGKSATLKKGTRVWATRDGQPILKWNCSNPLLPKAPVLRQRPTPTSVSIDRGKGVLDPGASVLAPMGVEAPVGITLAMDTPGEPEVLVTIPTPGPPAPLALRTNIARTGLPLLPLAGAVGLVVRSQGTPRNTVPEPGTLALIALGSASLLALRRRPSH